MSTTRLAPAARGTIARAIAEAGGREVAFVADVAADGTVTAAEVVARGTAESVLALAGAAGRGQMAIHNHPSGALEPSAADLDVAVRLHDAGVGFGIVNNDASELYVVVEVPKARVMEPIDPVMAANLLKPGGRIARLLGTPEDRPSQRDMAAYVADAYNEGGVALLEAGTGVGKSFAYLAPAVLWAIQNGERTIVSTNTINLQEQLVGSDLPTIARALGTADRPVRYALLKGWRNYLCLARLHQATGAIGTLLEPERRDELDTLAAWAKTTTDGSLATLTFEPSDVVWDEIAAESDLCPRLRCPHFNACFVFAARRRAADADVVVVNHHLLASDLAVRQAQGNWDDAAVLPPYRRLILDEGHHLEDTAAEHLGKQATSRGVERLFSRLERQNRGLLPALRAALAGTAEDRMREDALAILRETLVPALAEARRAAEHIFRFLEGQLAGQSDNVIRLTDALVEGAAWSAESGDALTNLSFTFGRLRDGIVAIIERLTRDTAPDDRLAQLLAELRGVAGRLDAARDAVATAIKPPPGAPPLVRWLERRGAAHVGVAAMPLELAPLLKAILFDRVETVVVTSATLAVSGSFDFLTGRLGVDIPPVRPGPREVLPSPFDFRNQCWFGIPDDLPEPRGDSGGHADATVDVVCDVARAADGGMFVLFTSYKALRAAAAALRARPEVTGRWPLLVQGEGPRDLLLRRFRQAGSAILLGTDSFWEGVDVPGMALRALVIAKLPFRPPTEPITAARLEMIEAAGGNAFNDYLVPLAALKLKQGFGRLIRSRTDVGAVVLLDRRVLQKRYGAALLAGLPPATRRSGPWAVLRGEMEEFFSLHGIGEVRDES